MSIRNFLFVCLMIFSFSISFCFSNVNIINAQCNNISGTTGADNLNGTSICDNIFGLSGNDTIKGNCGLDNMFGGSGFDTIFFNASDGDKCRTGLGGGNCFCPDSTCIGTCQFDFTIKSKMLPVSTEIVSEITGDPEALDFAMFGCENKGLSLDGVVPSSKVIKHFAAAGFGEKTGLPEMPSDNHMSIGFGDYSVKQDPENENVLIVEIPAYSKDESLMAASEIFMQNGDSSYTMYDHSGNIEILLQDVDYVRFNGTALIPVQ